MLAQVGSSALRLHAHTYRQQLKEGAENRGGVESVVRVVRKSVSNVNRPSLPFARLWYTQLLSRDPPLSLPPNHKGRLHNGWAMVDAGDFAVHILSAEAKERYFGHWA